MKVQLLPASTLTNNEALLHAYKGRHFPADPLSAQHRKDKHMNTPHTIEWPSSALSFMAIDHPSEDDILGFIDACTPYRERDEAIMKRNIAFRLLGKTTGRLQVLPADPQPEPSAYVWHPGNKRMTRELCA